MGLMMLLAAGLSVMPLAEVRPGMACTIRTQATGDKLVDLPCTVSYVDSTMGSLHQIQVRLTEPEKILGDILETNPVMGGMSGSPVYIQGRLAGAVAQTLDGLLTGVAWCTPIEDMLTVRTGRELLGDTTQGPAAAPLQPGEQFFMCLVWGDVNVCSSGTSTVTDPATGYAYMLGHDNDTWESGTPKTGRGELQMPFWRASVEGYLLNSGLSNVSSYPKGPVAGTIFWHSEFGHVAAMSRLPKPITVAMTLAGRTYRFQVAQGPNSSLWVQWAVVQLYNRTLNAYGDCTKLRFTVTVPGLPETLRFTETLFFNVEEEDATKPHAAWSRLMNWLLSFQHPRIGTIDVVVTEEAVTGCNLFRLQNAELLPPGDAPQQTLHIDGTRDRDLRSLRIVNVIPTPPNGMYITDGVNLQKHIFAQGRLADVLPLLNTIDDRSALYLYGFTPPEYAAPTDPSLPAGVLERKPSLFIHSKLNLYGMAARMHDDSAIMFEAPGQPFDPLAKPQ